MSNIIKARYDGPSGTGVDVVLSLPDGQLRTVHVGQGHQLPTKLEDGTVIPASERDKLLATDDWSKVDVATDDKTKPAVAATPSAPSAGSPASTSTKKEG